MCNKFAVLFRASAKSRLRGMVQPLILSVLLCVGSMPSQVDGSDQAGRFTKQNSDTGIPYELAFNYRHFPYLNRFLVSPKGDWVAYTIKKASAEGAKVYGWYQPNGTPNLVSGHKIYVSNLKEKKTHEVCPAEGNHWRPSWSPDGNQLAFYSDRDGSPRLWLYEVSTEECRRVSDAVIKPSPFWGSQALWQPEGESVYVPLDPTPFADHSLIPQGDQEGAKQGLTVRLYQSGHEQEVSAEEENGEPKWSQVRLRLSKAHLAVVNVESGRARTLVSADDDAHPKSMRLSSSGRWISFRSVGYPKSSLEYTVLHDLYVMPAAGGRASLLVKGMEAGANRNHFLNYHWHPDQDMLVYVKDGRIWRVDFNELGPTMPNLLSAALEHIDPDVVYFTRDSDSLVVGINPVGQGFGKKPTGFSVVALNNGKRATTLPLDEESWDFVGVITIDERTVWQPDGKSIAVHVRHKESGERAVLKINTTTGKSKTVWRRLARINALSGDRSHKYVVGAYEDAQTPPDLYLFPGSMLGGKRLSNIEPRLGRVRAGTAKVIQTTVPLYNGALENVRTTLLLPAGAKCGDRLPAIVMIYSGKDLSYSAELFGGGRHIGNGVPNIVFTSRGYAVVMPDVKLGPYGELGNPISQIVDVLLPQIYHAAELGYIDLSRLAVSGVSYGGYSSAAIPTRTNLFRAAIPVNGLFDLGSQYGRMHDTGTAGNIPLMETSQGRMGTHPWADTKRYIDNSPYYQLDKVTTPMLIIAGEADGRVPFEESKKLFVGLRRLGRAAELAVYEGEGHVIKNWSIVNAADVSKRMIGFLEKHIGAGWKSN